MCDGGEIGVRVHGRQGCLVACVWTEHGMEKGFQTQQTQPDVAPEYRTHRTRRTHRTHRMHGTQSPDYQHQDVRSLSLTQDGFLLMQHIEVGGKIGENVDHFLHGFARASKTEEVKPGVARMAKTSGSRSYHIIRHLKPKSEAVRFVNPLFSITT